MDTEFNSRLKKMGIPLLTCRPCCHDYSWTGSAWLEQYTLSIRYVHANYTYNTLPAVLVVYTVDDCILTTL